MRARSSVALVSLSVLSLAALAGCTKPAPGATVFASTHSAYREASCWAFDTEALDPGECAQEVIEQALTGDAVSEIPVIPGQTIGISVDPVVADQGWYPVLGNQRLTSTPVTTTYYRFAYPDLQAIPADGLALQIVAGAGEATRGIWVFKIVQG
jgi:hypothetical protein